MKKLLFILMALSFAACGGGKDESEESKAAYYIHFGEKSEESNSGNDIQYFADKIAQITEFGLNGLKLEIKEMTAGFDADPMSVESKTYDGRVFNDEESTHCQVTITKVTKLESDDMKTDYDLEGTIKAMGQGGDFKVTLFKMNY